MLDNFDYRFSEEMRAQIDTLNATVTDGSFTVREVTIVASLIEKETASASESPGSPVLFITVCSTGTTPPC